MKIKKFLLTVLPAVILIGAAGMYFYLDHSRNGMVNTKQLEVQGLRNQIETKKIVNQQAQDAVKNNTTGINMDRVSRDDVIVDEFLRDALDWSSYAEYTANRDRLIEKYSISNDSAFLSVFFPKVDLIELKDGTTVNIIDDNIRSGQTGGLNMSYVGMKSHVTKIESDVYSYLTEVEVLTSADNGSSASGTCIFLYSVDADGKLDNLDAYTILG